MENAVGTTRTKQKATSYVVRGPHGEPLASRCSRTPLTHACLVLLYDGRKRVQGWGSKAEAEASRARALVQPDVERALVITTSAA